jgi:hypothetical protein
LVLPDFGFGDLFFEKCQFLAALGSVKENSGGQRTACLAHQIHVAVLQSQLLLGKSLKLEDRSKKVNHCI